MNGSTNLQTSHHSINLERNNTLNQQKSLSSISEIGHGVKEITPNKENSFSSLAARELYLEMRKQLISQTEEFFALHCKDEKGITIEVFR